MGNKVPGKVTPPVDKLPENFTAIVTGGYAGLGFEVAKVLAILGGRVILAGDDENRARAAILRMKADQIDLHIAETDAADEMNEETASTVGSTLSTSLKELKLEFMHLNLRSLQSVTDFTQTFRNKGYPLNLILCNQAVIQVPQAYTEDGYETHFQVNHLSHMLLTILLTPELKQTGELSTIDSRVIIVTSASHANGVIDVKTVQGKGQYNKAKQYCNSRLYQVMSTICLQNRFENDSVSVFSMRGGSVESDVKKRVDDPDNWGLIYNTSKNLGGIMAKLAVSVNMCLNIALHPNMRELKGSYFSEGVPCATNPKAMKKSDQEIMWRYSLGCLQDFLTVEQMKELQERYDNIESDEETR